MSSFRLLKSVHGFKSLHGFKSVHGFKSLHGFKSVHGFKSLPGLRHLHNWGIRSRQLLHGRLIRWVIGKSGHDCPAWQSFTRAF